MNEKLRKAITKEKKNNLKSGILNDLLTGNGNAFLNMSIWFLFKGPHVEIRSSNSCAK